MRIKVFAVGGTIDKIYFDAKSEFQVGEPQIQEVFDVANVTFDYDLEALIAKDSLDMTDEDRQIIHDRVSEAAEDLILITHGTDTMVDTARYLNDVKDKTIVLTGAMQPARMKTSDAVFNIGSAVGALQALPKGTYVAMNGIIFKPENVRKNVNAGKFEQVP
ncbi:MAG TPA: asparaginase domain-containing protein [Bacteroidales bacterium]|nr:asparaginase domain-containing protein [Bacteroidales bacterium]